MPEATVMDLTAACHSFPELTAPQIDRANLLDTIDTLFGDGTEVILIEGPEGIGRTTLLAQFALRHPHHTVSLFVRPVSRLGCDAGTLRFDLCNQLHWALRREEIKDPVVADISFIHRSLLSLQKLARQQGETFFFAVDGLDQLPQGYGYVRDVVFDLLPLGLRNFRFLLAGKSDLIPGRVRDQLALKEFPIPPFIRHETTRYLAGLSLSEQIVDEVHATCKGMPGYLASIRRLAARGANPDVFLTDLPSHLPGLFEVEWRSADPTDAVQMRLLAILAYDRREHTIEHLAALAEVDAATADQKLRSTTFVTISAKGTVAFASDSFRAFAAHQLRDMRESVTALIIGRLLQQPHSTEALEHLPMIYEQEGRLGDLLDYLSPENLSLVVESCQSFAPLQQKAQLGLSAARTLHRDGDLVRFSIQQATVGELDGAQVWRSEVKALTALDDYAAALALAQSTVLREDRLHLLAVIARAQRESGTGPEPELAESIRRLCAEIDPSTLGEKAIDIAADLIHSEPGLAIQLLEQSAGSEGGENRLDWALARLSLAALRSSNGTQEVLESVRSHIQQPDAQAISATASLLSSRQSAERVVAEAEQVTGASNRLFILRHWALANRKRQDAAVVMDYALKTAIGTTEYAPNAKVFRELAEPLPFIDDPGLAQHMVGRFDSQRTAVERLGPTEDYVRLQLLLARSEGRRDMKLCISRLTDVYYYVLDLSDLATKVACMARLVGALAQLDEGQNRDDLRELRSASGLELEQDIHKLLRTTAYHYHSVRRVVQALAETEHEAALQYSLALNTQDRRDRALRDLIESVAGVDSPALPLAFLRRAISHIVDQDDKDAAILSLLEAVPRRLAGTPGGSLLGELKELCEGIRDGVDRCRAYCILYQVSVAYGSPEGASFDDGVLVRLRSAWDAIDVGWVKIDAGFRIAAALSRPNAVAARSYVAEATALKPQVGLESEAAASAYIMPAQLTVRAFRGLLPRRVDTADDLDRIAVLVDRIPSGYWRALLWSQVALGFHMAGRRDECRALVAARVNPVLDALRGADDGSEVVALVMVAPALYSAHVPTALDRLGGLSEHDREDAYALICRYILTKRPPGDAYRRYPGRGYDLSYDDLVEILDLMELMTSDGKVYSLVEAIADTLVAYRKQGRFSAQQISDVLLRLGKLIPQKLPDQRNIRHEGYRILADAQCLRIRALTGQAGQQQWAQLISAARDVPNTADQAFVLSALAGALAGKGSAMKRSLLEEAHSVITTIPTLRDRVDRLTILASYAVDVDQTLSKQWLQSAMALSTEKADSDVQDLQRDIIDLAHRLDPDLAASLASISDSDPARAKAAEKTRERLRVLRLSTSISENPPVSEHITARARSEYARAAWMLLGSLNAGMAEPVHIEKTRHLPELAAGIPISDSYPLLSWVIENASRRLADTDQASQYLRPVFEAALLGTELAAHLTSRSAVSLRRTRAHALSTLDSGSSVIVRPGDRESALQLLRDWFENSVQDYVKICDPYFGPDELPFLQMLSSAKPGCKIQILTSAKYHERLAIARPWEDAYRQHWRLKVSQDDPPDADIVVIGTASDGEPPIHDRWCLTRGAGISLGTSLNSLGTSKSSAIAILSSEDAARFEAEVDRYLQRTERAHRGQRLQWVSFTL